MGVKHPVVCRCSNKVLALKKGTKEHFTMNGSIIWSIGYNRMFCNSIYRKFSSGGCFFLRVLVENVVSTIYRFCVNSSGFYDTRCRIYMLLTVVGIHLHLFNSSSLLVYFLCTLRSGGGGCDNPSGFTIAG